MKTIGLIGGVSWESTKEYYRIINETVHQRLGSNHSAKLLMYSFDFNDIINSNWQVISNILSEKAGILENAGADCVLICANTLHKVFEVVQNSISIPVLHIADPLGKSIKQEGFHKVGLLGTKTTMEEDFYANRLKTGFGIETLIPSSAEREIIQTIIYKELTKGVTLNSSRRKFQKIIKKLVENGSEGIILGCTEIPLLIKREDVRIPIFDTTRLHAEAAVDFALNNKAAF